MQLEGAGESRIHWSLDALEDTIVHDFPNAPDLFQDLFVCVSVTLFILKDELSDCEIMLVAES